MYVWYYADNLQSTDRYTPKSPKSIIINQLKLTNKQTNKQTDESEEALRKTRIEMEDRLARAGETVVVMVDDCRRGNEFGSPPSRAFRVLKRSI